MDKKLIDRLITVADNLRDVEGDLIRACGKQYPPEQILVGRLGIELDILDSIIDGLEREVKRNAQRTAD